MVDDKVLPLYFDGWKCYFKISKPKPADLCKYPTFTLTSERQYEPQQRLVTRCLKQTKGKDIDKWRARLGFPTFDTTTSTLENTTQYVQILEAESREYMRDYYRTRAYALQPKRINDVLFSDTFFPQIRSIRGYKAFQMFAYK